MSEITEDSIRAELRRRVKAYGDNPDAINRVARELGVGLFTFEATLWGTESPSDAIIAALGLRRVVAYERISE